MGLVSVEAHAHADVQTAIWTEDSGDPAFLSAAGGFQVDVHADIGATGEVEEIACWNGICVPIFVFVDRSAYANVYGRYRWRIEGTIRDPGVDDRGILTVEPLDVTTRSGKDNLAGWFISYSPLPSPQGPYRFPNEQLHRKIQWELRETLPGEVKKGAAEEQVREIPTIMRVGRNFVEGVPVPCNTEVDCANAPGLVGRTPGSEGSLELAILGLPQVVPELAGNEASFRAIINDPSEWRCEATKSDVNKTCRMLVRGKRVNVYPDSVEIVFREAGDWPITRETLIEGLLLLADKYGGTNLRAQRMCDAPEHGKESLRAFVRKAQDTVYD